MARKKTEVVEAVPGEATEARALVDLPNHGVKGGELLVAEPAVIAALVAAGAADAHPDAVAYAKG